MAKLDQGEAGLPQAAGIGTCGPRASPVGDLDPSRLLLEAPGLCPVHLTTVCSLWRECFFPPTNVYVSVLSLSTPIHHTCESTRLILSFCYRSRCLNHYIFLLPLNS